MVRNASLAGLLLAAAGASTTYAATEIGQSVSGFVELAGKQVALPEGSWTLVARSFDDVEELDGDAYGAIETSVLFRLNGQVVEGFVTASRNLAPIEEGWGTANECLAEDVELPLVVQYDAAGAHTFCGFASEVRNVVTASSPDAWREAAEFGRAQGLVPAGEWLMAGYRLSDRYDVLDVRYHFNPALRAAAPPEPMPDAADEDLSEGLGEWLNQMRDSVRVGFYNGLAGIAPMPMPWAEAAEEPSPVTAAKLAKLAVLRKTGVLDEVQFKAQQALRRPEAANRGDPDLERDVDGDESRCRAGDCRGADLHRQLSRPAERRPGGSAAWHPDPGRHCPRLRHRVAVERLRPAAPARGPDHRPPRRGRNPIIVPPRSLARCVLNGRSGGI
jgi:hypothetical protein